MKLQRVLLLASILLAGWPNGLAAQEWARNMFSDHSHDFGIVAAGSEAVHRFEFQNTYKEDVHVASVRSSCGCTSASIEKQDLKTWEKSAIIARFNTASFRDQRQATLTVTIDRPYPAEVQLLVRGNIRADVAFEPGSARFGDILAGKSGESKVRVIHRGNPSWSIVDVKTTFDDSKIRVRLNEATRGNGIVAYDLIVELLDNIEPGYVTGELFVETNEGIRYPLTFNGRVVAPLEVSPEILPVGPLSTGEVINRRVLVRAGQPFRITGIQTSDPGLRVRASNEERTLHVLDLTFTAGNQPGRREYEATINTSLGPDLTARLKAIALVESSEQAASAR